MAQGVEVVGVVGREGHRQPQDRGSHRPDPGPQLPTPDAVGDQDSTASPVAAMNPDTAMCRWLM